MIFHEAEKLIKDHSAGHDLPLEAFEEQRAFLRGARHASQDGPEGSQEEELASGLDGNEEEPLMTISFEIPCEIEQELGTKGDELNGEAREAFLVELYRQERITQHQLAEALGLNRYETDEVSSGTRFGLSLPQKSWRLRLLRSGRPDPHDRHLGHDAAQLPGMVQTQVTAQGWLRASAH